MISQHFQMGILPAGKYLGVDVPHLRESSAIHCRSSPVRAPVCRGLRLGRARRSHRSVGRGVRCLRTAVLDTKMFVRRLTSVTHRPTWASVHSVPLRPKGCARERDPDSIPRNRDGGRRDGGGDGEHSPSQSEGMDAGMEPAVHPKRYGFPLPSQPKRTEASVPVHPLWDGGGMACPRYGGGEVHPSSGWRCGSIPMAPSLWAGWTGGMDCSLLCCPRVVSYPVPVAQTPQGGGYSASYNKVFLSSSTSHGRYIGTKKCVGFQ